MRYYATLALLTLTALITMAIGTPVRAQSGTQIVYDDALENGWQNYGWATLNYTNTSPVHSGSDSISVTASAYQALYIHHAAFDSTPYTAVTFWINGGAAGGQTLQVQAELSGTAQTAYSLPAPAPNTWQQVTIPLAALGASAKPNLDGFWIQNTGSGNLPTFYVDDIALVGSTAPQPTSAHLSVNAGQVVRTLDGRIYGLNTAIWDSNLGTAASVSLLGQIQTQILRFPGGSASDVYDWTTNRSDGATYTWASSFATFAALAVAAHSQACITVDYGSGTPQMAAAWVAYANGSPASTQAIGVDAKGRDWKTVGAWASLRAATPLATDDGYNFLRVGRSAPFGFHDWEVGNECYGSWENDQHGVSGSGLTGLPQDPYTYAQYAAQFYRQMKAVDPTIQVGVVGIPGEDTDGDGQHAVPNPNEGGSLHSGWTPVVLATLASLSVTPDFVIYHRYEQAPGGESDASLLTDSSGINGWASAAANLRQMLTDYVGAPAPGVQLLATENNSVYGNPGKQSVSLVNGLYMADSIGSLAGTEIDSLMWWDFRNGSSSSNNDSPSLYGWREFGDYGIVATGDRSDTPVNTPFPTFYAAKLLTHWARGGDKVVSASSDYNLLSIYAAQLQDGNMALLVINKDPSRDLTGHVALTGFVPGSTTATVFQYGKPEDLANADLTQTSISDAGSAFDEVFPSYSMSVVVLSAPVSLPTIAVAAAATPAPVTGTQTSASVLGADAAGESTLTYTWSATGPAAVTFSPNGTNAAKNATATFTKAGSYDLTVTVADASGHSVQSSVAVAVAQTLTALTVTPPAATLAPGQTQQFNAAGTDQFGAPLPAAPAWAVDGGGAVTPAGLFTAGTAPGGPYALTATQAGVTAAAQVTVAAPTPPVDDAAFVSQSVPAAMAAGQDYPATLTFRNTGTTTWTDAAAYHLGSQDPQDNTTWLAGTNRAHLPPGDAVAPGQDVTFSLTVTAPAAPGTYPFQWRLVRDGVRWFGDDSPALGVTVAAPAGAPPPTVDDAAFVSQSVPAAMAAGQDYPATLTFRNTGTTTWTDAAAYHLGSQDPQDNTTWLAGTNRAHLPPGDAVAPGQDVTFSLTVTAPAAPGTYPFQWRLVRDGVHWFGDDSPALGVAVAAPAGAPSPVAQVNAGGGAAAPFAADQGYSGGSTYATGAAIDTSGVTGAAPPSVYQSERFGDFTYTVPGLTPGGPYTLRLHFAEIYWGAAGQRLFNVSVNGSPFLTDFDVFAAAGGKDRAVVESVPVTADASGRVTVVFTTLKDNAKVSGIELVH